MLRSSGSLAQKSLDDLANLLLGEEFASELLYRLGPLAFSFSESLSLFRLPNGSHRCCNSVVLKQLF